MLIEYTSITTFSRVMHLRFTSERFSFLRQGVSSCKMELNLDFKIFDDEAKVISFKIESSMI